MKGKFVLFVTVFILSFISSKYAQNLPKDWYCDQRLTLNLQIGTVAEITPYLKTSENSVPAAFIKNGVKYKTTAIVKFEVENLDGKAENSASQTYFVTQTKNAAATDFRLGEKYLFEPDSVLINRPQPSAEYSFIRPGAFFKLYENARSDIEFLRAAKNTDKNVEILGTGEGKFMPTLAFSDKFLNIIKPEYPPELKKAKIEETVKVLVLVSEDGTVIKVRSFCVVNQLFAEAAEKAALSSKFIPTKIDGSFVKIKGIITYVFTP